MARERQRGKRGLEQALARLNAADAAQDEDGALIALVEGVAWVTALDEWLLVNVRGYTPERRDAEASGQAVRAMRWLGTEACTNWLNFMRSLWDSGGL